MPSPAQTVKLLASDPATLAPEDIAAGIVGAEELRSWVAAREGRFVRAFDELPQDPSSPAKDTAEELGCKQKVGRGQAKRRAERAKQLSDLPETEDALENGSITDAHADVLARARAKADASARAALEADEARLLEHATRETPHEFQLRVDRFVQEHSQDDGLSEWSRKKGRRRLSLWRDKDGMTQLRGTFDPESGQIIRSTIERVAEELFRRDHRNHPADEPVPLAERTNEQRNADALTEVCRRADQVDGPAKRKNRGVVFLSYEDLVDRLSEHGIPSTLADGTPIPASVARRMACDAGLIPMVLSGDSVPLDEGRAKRDPTPAQRLALEAQWSTCAIADCTIPFVWTQIHHIDPFNEHGHQGPTDLDNLVPACDHGHDLAHTPGWTVEKLADGRVVTTAPDGTRWERSPNGPAARRRSEPPRAAATEVVRDESVGTPDRAPETAATLFSDAA